MLRELVPGEIWVAEMPFGRLGFHVGARMTVAKLASGELFVHSPIALTAELRHSVEYLGTVAHLVAPSRFHVAHLPEWASAFPEAHIHGVPGVREGLKTLPAVGLLQDTPPPDWAGVLDQTIVRGSRVYDEIDFLHVPSRTLILTDLCFHVPKSSDWSTRLWAKALDVYGHLSSSRSFILTMKDRSAARASIERILNWDFERVIISHGEITEREGKARFREAFAWLLR